MTELIITTVWCITGLWVLLDWLRALHFGLRARQQPVQPYILNGSPFVSILIPAWKERTTLEKTLTALNQLDYQAWEAIVIAGGADGTESFARELCRDWQQFKVVSQPPHRKNAAFNLGYAQAKGEIIVLLDADCIVKSDWLRHLISPLTEDYSASLANYFATERNLISDYFEMEKLLSYELRAETTLHGGAIAVRREVIDQIGGFPEDVTVGVDWDFDVRVSQLNIRKAFVRYAHHRTHLPGTLRRYIKDEIRWRRAYLQLSLGLMGNLAQSFLSLSFYLIAFLFVIALPAGLIFSLLLRSIAPLSIALTFMGWVLLRRVSPVISILIYTRDPRWLAQLLGTPVLLVVSFFSSLMAITTLRKRLVFFQGPRPELGGNLS